MSKPVDKELISGFVSEVKSYIPQIETAIENFKHSSTRVESIEEVRRFIQNLKGASSMIGVTELSDISNYVEKILEDIASNKVNFTDEVLLFLRNSLEYIIKFLDNIPEGDIDFQSILNDVRKSYNKLTNQPDIIENSSDIELEEAKFDVEHEFSNVLDSSDNLNFENKETSLSNESELETSMDFSEENSKMPDEPYEVFKVEAREHLSIMKTRLEELVPDTDNHLALQDIRRGAHTIMGDAGMLGLQAVSELSFEMENVLDQIVDNDIVLDPELINILMLTSEVLEKIISENIDNSLQKEIANLKKQYKDIKSFVSRKPNSTINAPVSSKPSSDIPPELLGIFLVEANKHLQNMGQFLNRVTQDLNDKESLQEVRRSVHTIKGAAGMVGFDTVSKISHRMGDMLDNLYEGTMNLDDNNLDLLFKTSDLLEDIVNDKIDGDDLNMVLSDIYANYNLLLGDGVDIAQSIDNVSDFKKEELFIGLHTGGTFDMDDKPKTGTLQTKQVLTRPGEFVRMPIERLDELLNLFSELVVNRSAFEQHFSRFVQELDELSSSLDRLGRVTSNLKTQYEAIMLGGGKLHPVYETGKSEAVDIQALNQQTHELDELEFDRYTEFHKHARELSESTSDIRAVGSQIRDLTGDFYSYLDRQECITSEVQDKLMRLRMVPLATLATRLHRTARVTASQQNKKVELLIQGEDVELDKTVLEEMSDPLLHIIKNSVDHGIELPELRKDLNKNEIGTIYLKAYYEGTQVVVQVGDDASR